MFSNFSSKDFAKVLLVEEMSQSSLSQIVMSVMREGVEVEVVGRCFSVQRNMLGLSSEVYKSYLEILSDELIVNSVRYYGKCEELKLVLVLYSIEYREAYEDGSKVDMFKLIRTVQALQKFLNRARGNKYDFKGYEDLIREWM